MDLSINVGIVINDFSEWPRTVSGPLSPCLGIELVHQEALDDRIARRSVHRHIETRNGKGNEPTDNGWWNWIFDHDAEVLNAHHRVVGRNEYDEGDSELPQ